MQVHDKLNMAQRPYLGAAVLLVLSLCIAAASAWKMSAAGREMRAGLASERLVSDWTGNVISNVKRTTVLIESADPRLVSIFSEDLAASSKRNTELMKKVEGVLDTEEEKILFARIAENRRAYQASRDTAFRLLSEGSRKEVYKALEEQYRPVAKRYQEVVAELLQLERQQLGREAHVAGWDEAFNRTTIIGSLMAVLLTAAGAAWWLNARARARRPETGPGASGDGAFLLASNAVVSRHSQPFRGADEKVASADSAGTWDEFFDILA